MQGLGARAQIGPVKRKLTGQPADLQALRGAARVGRLILASGPERSVWAVVADT